VTAWKYFRLSSPQLPRRRTCTVSYDYVLLSDAVRQSLSGKPFRSLRDLSQELQVSKGTLEKAVYIATGKTFVRFRENILVIHLMNSFAARPGCTVREMSVTLGYKSPRSFARAIRRASGLSPKKLRSLIAQALSDGHSKGRQNLCSNCPFFVLSAPPV